MAQRKPTPISPVVAIDDEMPVVTSASFAPARQRPSIPARTQVQFERQLIRQQFRKERAALAIRLTGELHAEAGEEVAQSLLYSNLLRRGFGEELTQPQEALFDELDRILAAGVTGISIDAVQELLDMAREAGLPSDAVTDWDTFCRWLATH